MSATVAIVGFPNVGKSTLVNRLVGGTEAVTAPEPGVTRDRKRLATEWNGMRFELIDTGGIDLGDEAELARDIQAQARLAIDEADAILMVVDGRAGLRAGDAELARTLRGAEVPVLVVVNKADRRTTTPSTAEFHGLGLGDPRRSPRRTGSAPATCSTRSSSRSATAAGPTRTTTRSGSP